MNSSENVFMGNMPAEFEGWTCRSQRMAERRRVDATLDRETWSAEIVPINGPDDLRETTRGSDVEIVQLKPGRLLGSIKHFGIGNLGISLGQFDSAVRMRGGLHQERIVLGTILDSAGHVTQWWKDVRPGDIGVFPALTEFDAIHGGGAAYLLVSIALPELLAMLGGEEDLADPAFWNTKRVYNTDSLIGAKMLQRHIGIVSGIEKKSTAPSDQVADFLQRSIIEPFVLALMSALPSASLHSYAGALTGARLVSETEDYMDASEGRPVHISELCYALKVSRRSLHRAFTDTLGIGPAAYLRRRRLSAIRSILSRSHTATISIGDLAFEYGFTQPGRFAAYYRTHFGETPSETLRSRSMSTQNAR
jgi:AraC family ethanolamine operon transcriptional activator